jgi:hypothetical protein
MTHPDTTDQSLSIRDLGPWSSLACAGGLCDRLDGCGNALEPANHQFVERRAWAQEADRVDASAQDRAGERPQRGVGVPRPSDLYGWSFRLR